MHPADSLAKELLDLKDPKKAETFQRFFKTGPGQYGEGDVFLGIDVPTQRNLAKKYKDLSLKEIEKLLQKPLHEFRLTALFILVNKFKTAGSDERKEIFDLYLRNLKHINNWDLVDSSAPYILGLYLLDKNKDLLYELASSSNLWEKRVSIMATFAFIRQNMYEDAIQISEMLLEDKHDLIHKAVGWMLREIGNRNLKTETGFLDKYYKKMPRTMLRYAIEKFDSPLRLHYLAK